MHAVTEWKCVEAFGAVFFFFFFKEGERERDGSEQAFMADVMQLRVLRSCLTAGGVSCFGLNNSPTSPDFLFFSSTPLLFLLFKYLHLFPTN